MRIITERYQPSHNVTIKMNVEKYPGEPDGDTTVTIMAIFAIPGGQRKEFIKRLDQLISEYRI